MKRPKGFSLLEVLVSVAILLIVVAGTLGTLTDALRASEGATRMAEVQDNLRASMNLMIRDLVLAGQGLPTGGVSVPFNSTGVGPVPPPINRPSPPGLNYQFPVGPVISAITPGAFMGPVSLGRNTDMITILYADNTLPWSTMAPINNPANPKCNGTIAANGSQVSFDTVTPGCATLTNQNVAVRPNDLIMFTNANGNMLETVTDVGGSTLFFAAGDAFNLNGQASPNGIYQLQNKGAGGNPDGTYPPTSAIRVWMITYYLDTTNANRPELVRQVNFNPGQVVGQVLEDLQTTYDVVNAVATVPPNDARQITPPDSPNQIRKVNLYLAARSEFPFSKTGQFFRANLVTQVGPRSLAFVNRFN